MTLTHRARLTRWSLMFWPLAFAWYRFTQLATLYFRVGANVKPSESLREAVAALGDGTRYKADRKALDVMTHPRVVQARINRGAFVGDCEDHAVYIVSSVGGPNAGFLSYMFSVMMFDPKTGETSGHVLQGCKIPYGFQVADYDAPVNVFGFGYLPAEWQLQNGQIFCKSYTDQSPVAVGRYVAEVYGRTLLGVAWTPVSVDSSGGVRFHLRGGGHWRNDQP